MVEQTLPQEEERDPREPVWADVGEQEQAKESLFFTNLDPGLKLFTKKLEYPQLDPGKDERVSSGHQSLISAFTTQEILRSRKGGSLVVNRGVNTVSNKPTIYIGFEGDPEYFEDTLRNAIIDVRTALKDTEGVKIPLL